MKHIKKHNISRILIILFCFVLTGCTGCNWFSGCTLFEGCSNHHVTNEKAIKEKEQKRFITVINGTNLTINSVEITAGDGISVATLKNPDDTSFSFEIVDTWKDYEQFHIVLMDVYDLHYEKTVKIPETGKVDVKITQNDYVEYDGDYWRRWEKKANGD